MIAVWIADNIIEIFGAVTGIAYVILEIKRNILLWPLGIITSAVYIYVFGSNGFYANMGLQWYYLLISIYGWHKWHREQSTGLRAQGKEQGAALNASSIVEEDGAASFAEAAEGGADIRRIDFSTAVASLAALLLLWALLWYTLDRWTDSPVPLWDGLIASLSVVATWMLTRKILEQWYMWIVANTIAVIVYFVVGMYPTAVLFVVYTVMAILGLRAWSMEREAYKASGVRCDRGVKSVEHR
jgi:nicotinamide mononucleotide transporter